MHNLDNLSLEILTKYKSGSSCSDLAQQYNVKYMAIWKLLKKSGAVFQRNKLSKEQEKAMMEEYVTGISASDLSAKYGVSQVSVANYARRNNVEIHGPSRKNLMNIDFFKTLTPESIWVLGWFFSDGNVSKKTNRFSLSVHLNDQELPIKIGKVMGFNRDAIHYCTTKKMVQFYADEKTVHDDLIALGCIPAKSLIIRYPEALTENWQHWAFLRGVLEGDGHISLKTDGNRPGFNCEIASGSKDFLDGVAKILKERLNIETKIIERAGTNSKRICILGGKEPILRFLDCLYKDCPEYMRLARKYAIYLNMHEVNITERLPAYFDRSKMREGYLLSPRGEVYFIRGVYQFSRELGVSSGCIFNLLKPITRRSKSHRYGWTRPTPDQIEAARANGTLIEKIY